MTLQHPHTREINKNIYIHVYQSTTVAGKKTLLLPREYNNHDETSCELDTESEVSPHRVVIKLSTDTNYDAGLFCQNHNCRALLKESQLQFTQILNTVHNIQANSIGSYRAMMAS